MIEDQILTQEVGQEGGMWSPKGSGLGSQACTSARTFFAQ